MLTGGARASFAAPDKLKIASGYNPADTADECRRRDTRAGRPGIIGWDAEPMAEMRMSAIGAWRPFAIAFANDRNRALSGSSCVCSAASGFAPNRSSTTGTAGDQVRLAG